MGPSIPPYKNKKGTIKCVILYKLGHGTVKYDGISFAYLLTQSINFWQSQQKSFCRTLP